MASSSTSHVVSHVILLLLLCLFSFWTSNCYGQAMVPAIYVFGDSLADVGNNNYLDFSLLKADFPHNGVDFPGGKATGRFSNGKNSADFLAEKVGLTSSPPYLSLTSSSNKTDTFLKGVSFASGGAGVLDITNSGLCLTFNKQIDYYSSVYAALVQQLGSNQTLKHLSKSIFSFVIGSNDMLNYAKPSSADRLKSTPLQFIDSLASALQGQLKKIYNLGARKFMFVGSGPIGCCPEQRHQNTTGDCNEMTNYLSVQYNQRVVSLLQEMKAELGDMSYSFFNTSSVVLNYIHNPTAYGFKEVKDACCGLGNPDAKGFCLPISTYCSNRKDHIFWDIYHPTETTAGMLTDTAFDGSPPHVHPINVRQLVAL